MFDKWDKVISHRTFASWKGRGINASDDKYNIVHAIKKIISKVPLHTDLYCLKLDIKKCYDNVNTDILMKYLYCSDKDMIELINKIVKTHDGLPIGTYYSQLLINLYLNPIDRYIENELKVKYVRYMDDISLFSTDKAYLHECKHRLQNFIFYTLDLELNSKTQIFPIAYKRKGYGRPLDTCGYCFFRTFTLVRKRIKRNIMRKKNNKKSMASYNGILLGCDSKHFIKHNNLYKYE